MKQKRTNYFISHGYWLIPLLIILVGCVASLADMQNDEDLESDINMVPTTTMTPIPSTLVPLSPSITPTVSEINTSVPTLTITPLPTNTSTATSIPVATLTPLPTVPPQQRGQVYNELMDNNRGCNLPCWWGFELGKASLDEVRQFYESFDAHIFEEIEGDGFSTLYITFVDPEIEDGIQVRHWIVAQNDVVIEAWIAVIWHPNYQIESILQNLGQPSEIWMWTIPEQYEDSLPASFRLYFPEIGVLVSYATTAQQIDEVVQTCFDKIGGVLLLLWEPSIWDPDGVKGIVERGGGTGSRFSLDTYLPIEEVSNWNAEQFYTILTDPTRSDCLQTPSELWPAP